MKRLLVFVPLLAVFLSSCNHSGNSSRLPESVTMSKEVLLDKIKGGWAGQTIGCSYGGPTEFDFKGGMITNYTPIPWPDGYIKWWYETSPSLYDDVYMDLTFVGGIRPSRPRCPGGFHRDGFRNGRIPPVARKPGGPL